MFVEKYRPKRLSQLKGQDKVLNQLIPLIEDNKKPPHLLFSGPPGCGKTTAAYAITLQCLGDKWKKSTLVLNASDDRGIDTIRNNIKIFAKTKGMNGFKIVILDEADNLTPDAQKALKGIIEGYQNNCSFILTANEPSDIIDPIKDRCSQFYFKPIEDETAKEMINIVVKNEKIDFPENLYDNLIKSSNGSFRKILYDLENFKALNRTIYLEDFNILPEDKINELIKEAFKGTENGFFEARRIGLQLIKEGTTTKNINSIIFNRIHKSKFDEQIKAKLFIYLQESDRNISTGAVSEIQLIGFLSKVFILINKV